VWYYDAENGETGPEELADYEPLRDDVDFEVAKLDTEKTDAEGVSRVSGRC